MIEHQRGCGVVFTDFFEPNTGSRSLPEVFSRV